MFTIIYNGEELSLAGWGVHMVRRRLVSRGLDIVTFEQVAFSGTVPLFPYGAELIFKRDGIQWFVGTVVDLPHDVGGSSGSIGYTVAGPWRHLERRIFQRLTKTYTGDPENLGETYLSNVFLNANPAGGYFTTGAEIANVIAFLVAQGAPIQLALDGLPALMIPVTEVRDMSCAEVVLQMLHLSPDAVTWFDYSTTPPTLHVKRRADLVAKTLRYNPPGTPGRVAESSITPLHDRQLSAVVIKYQRSNTVDGTTWFQTATDKYPVDATGLEDGAFVATVDLRGFSATTNSAGVTTQTVNAYHSNAATRLEWWKAKFPYLNDPRCVVKAADLIMSPTASPTTLLWPRELIGGSIVPWMQKNAAKQTVKARVSWQQKNLTTGKIEKDTFQDELEVEMVVTDAVSGSFQNSQVTEYAESIPEGLAQEIYEAMSVLEYQGAMVSIEDQISGTASVGNALNLIGGRTEWETMGALIQSVDEEVDSGTTTINFGPPDHIGLADRIELQRTLRNRQVTNWAGVVGTAQAAGSGRVELPTWTPNTSAKTTPLGEPRVLKVTHKDGGYVLMDEHMEVRDKDLGHRVYVRGKQIVLSRESGPSIIINTDDLPVQAGEMKLRTIHICNPSNGTLNGMVVLGSNLFPIV